MSDPARASRIVYSARPRNAGGNPGSGTIAYEERRSAPVLQERLHDLQNEGATTILLTPGDPFYQRVHTGSGAVTLVLPVDYTKRGMEFHVTKLGGTGDVLVKPQDDLNHPDGPQNFKINGLEAWVLREAFAYVQARWTKEVNGGRQWDVVGRSGPSALLPGGGTE